MSTREYCPEYLLHLLYLATVMCVYVCVCVCVCGCQYMLLQHIPEMINHLSDLVPVLELSQTFCRIIGAVPKKRSSSTSQLNATKLTCIKQVLALPKFATAGGHRCSRTRSMLACFTNLKWLDVYGHTRFNVKLLQ